MTNILIIGNYNRLLKHRVSVEVAILNFVLRQQQMIIEQFHKVCIRYIYSVSRAQKTLPADEQD